jgi:hypothetical protein
MEMLNAARRTNGEMDKFRTCFPDRMMRRVTSSRVVLYILVIVTVCLSLSGSSVFPGPVGYGDAAGGDVILDLSLEFDSPSSGHLDFYMGTGPGRDLVRVDEPDLNISLSDNENLKKVYENLIENGREDDDLFGSVLDAKGSPMIENFTIYSLVYKGYFALSFSASFEFPDNLSRVEYTPFPFLYRIRTSDVDSITSLRDRLREEDELRDISISMEVELEKGLSIQKRSDDTGHWRTPLREGLSMKTNMFLFTKEKNDIAVSDHPLLSPFGTFLITITILILSGIVLYISWRRHRFAGFGWILPGTALAISICMPVMFFLPWISLYSLGGMTILIPGILLLLTVGVTLIVHPGEKLIEYKDEIRNIRKVTPPKIVYVDRPVYIRVNSGEGSREIDPYEVLEIPEDATLVDVEKAYRLKALEYHPDKYERSPKRIHLAAVKEMENVNRAYEYLKERLGE